MQYRRWSDSLHFLSHAMGEARKLPVVISFASIFVAQALIIAQPLLLGALVARYSQTAASVSAHVEWGLLAVFVAAWLGAAVFQSISGLVNAMALQELRVSSKKLLFAHVLARPRDFFQGAGAGDIETRISTASMCTRGIFVEVVSSVLRLLALTVFAIWAFSRQDWRLAAFYFVWLMAYLPVCVIASKGAPRLAGLAVNATAKVTAFMVDVISNAELVRASATQRQELGRAVERLSEERALYERGQLAVEKGMLAKRAMLLVLVCGMASIVWWTIGEGAAVPSAAATVMIVTLVLSFQLEAFGQGLVSIQELAHRLAQSLEGLRYTQEARRAAGSVTRVSAASDSEDAITLSGVSFAYPGKPAVLDKIDLRIPRGDRVGLVGPSGCGKSTLLNLIRGELQPTEGEVRLTVPRVFLLGDPSVAACVAYVSQDAPTLNRSLRENLLYGVDRPVTNEELVDVMQKVGLQALSADPAALDAPLGERGAKLSGGERQRIALVRALIRRVPVILLDEPTSALDSTNERLVDEVIASLPPDTTVLVVSHHVTNLHSLRRIVTIHDGRVQEQRAAWVAPRSSPAALTQVA